MKSEERDTHAGLCPRCGTEVDLSFVDEQKSRVEVACPNCGRYQMSREEFDEEEAEAEPFADPLP